MILIPQRLFEDSSVSVILRDGNTGILSKQLSQPTLNREGYISNHVISIVLKGTQRIKTYDDEWIEIRENEVLLIPRGMYHITDLLPKAGCFESLLFFFDDAMVQQFLSHSGITQVDRKKVPSHLKLGVQPKIQIFAQSVISLYGRSARANRSILPLKIQELLHLLSGLVSEQALSTFLFRLTLPKKRNLKSFMEQHFTKPLKVEDYAYLTGRSLSSFRRDFKQYFDTTPQAWLKERRMERALEMLNEKDITVTALAQEVGYENLSYFIKAFKNWAGVSPKQYLLAVRKDRSIH